MKDFFIYEQTKNTWRKVDGAVYPIEHPTLTGFAVHKSMTPLVGEREAEPYVVTEPMTGNAVATGRTRKEAVRRFLEDVDERGVDAYLKQIKKRRRELSQLGLPKSPNL